MSNFSSIVRKLSGIDDKAPTPPQTGHDERAMKQLYIILAFTIGMVLFGVVVAFFGFF
jgi:hypothetical protein